MSHLFDRDVKVGDLVEIADRSLNFGNLDGRAATLLEIRDDADDYDYRVEIIETVGLTTTRGKYETWVLDVLPLNRPDPRAVSR